MTVFLYVVVTFATGALWYMFFVRLHNNGRLMDIYWRLHGSEEQFFLPYDLEVSHEELSYICRKAEQWRGEEGERRKVAVYDYVWEQEEVKLFSLLLCRLEFSVLLFFSALVWS